MKRESKINIGEKYNHWTTKSKPLYLPNKKYRSILVECVCGHEQYVAVSALIQNKSTKCLFCLKSEQKTKRDLPIGTKYGEWTITGNSFINKKQTMIPVICSCGYKTNINKYCLLQPNTSLCCSSCASFKGIGELAGAYITELKRGAKERNLEFKITSEYIWELINNQKFKCALTGVDITVSKNWRKYQFTASLDRIDSSKGYVIGNVQWVHKTINKLKSNFSEQELLYWANLLVKQSSISS